MRGAFDQYRALGLRIAGLAGAAAGIAEVPGVVRLVGEELAPEICTVG